MRTRSRKCKHAHFHVCFCSRLSLESRLHDMTTGTGGVHSPVDQKIETLVSRVCTNVELFCFYICHIFRKDMLLFFFLLLHLRCENVRMMIYLASWRQFQIKIAYFSRSFTLCENVR